MDNSRMRTNRRRNYDKPQWEIDKENAEREKQEAIRRGLEQTEENFPRLGAGETKATSWSGRKFVELASEWKADEDARKAIEEMNAPVDRGHTDLFVMPKFTLTHHYTEDVEHHTPTPVPQVVATDSEDSGWTTVDSRTKHRERMIRKEARIQDRMRRIDNGEDVEFDNESVSEDTEDETCWNTALEMAPAGKGHDS